jgi:hypothetical protein
MKYAQGRSFPPTAQGAGLIFVLISILLFLIFDQKMSLLISYLSVWIMFSKTTIDTSRINEGIILRKFGLFPCLFHRKVKLQNYDAGLIKIERVRYRTTQSIGVVILSSQDTHDAFMALSLKIKGKYEFEVLFKGSRAEIMDFIRVNLASTHLRFFNGVLMKEHEINIEKIRN